jgi:acyl-coenzyme A synthetase/AMP-(fatty) acid ligase
VGVAIRRRGRAHLARSCTRSGRHKPKAFIVLRSGYAGDEGLLENLKLHVKERAGPWKYPRWIDIRTDLPRTATGKIQRFKLRAEESGEIGSR